MTRSKISIGDRIAQAFLAVGGAAAIIAVVALFVELFRRYP